MASARKEAGDSACDYPAGQPVWYRCNSDIGWWPCMVLQVEEDDKTRSVDLRALGDNHEYGWVTMGPRTKVKLFTSSDCQSIVQKQLARLKRRHKMTDLRNFVAGVREALQNFPSFSLDNVDLSSDEELGEYTATPTATPPPGPSWQSFLDDSEIFTPGSDSRSHTCGGSIVRSLRRQPRKQTTTPATPVECHSVPQRTTTDKAKTKSDILTKVVRMRSGGKKRRNHSASPYSNSEKKSKREEEEDEGEFSEANGKVRRKLDLGEVTEEEPIGDILAICESGDYGGGVRREGRENGDCGEDRECGEVVLNGRGNGQVSKCSGVLDGSALRLEGEEETPVSETTEVGKEEEEKGEAIGKRELEQKKGSSEEEEQQQQPEEREKENDEEELKKVNNRDEHEKKVGDEMKERVREGEEEGKEEGEEEGKEEGEEEGKEEGEEEGKEEGEEEGKEGKTTTTKEEESEASSEDDDLPNYQTTSTTKVTINDLKEGDHIWYKWARFPHWPALVVKARPARKKGHARAKIVYFGDNPDFKPVDIKHSKTHNLARYVRGNQEYEKFMKAGRECGKHADYFLRSVQEAEAFIAAKCNKELIGSTLEMFKQICEKRPASMTPPDAWMEDSLSFRQHEPPRVSAFGYRLDGDLRNRDEEEEEEEEETDSEDDSAVEEENSIYTLEEILQHFTKLKPTLIAIMSGAAPSEYHQVFTSGTAKQKQQLTLCSKYGPCKTWKTSKKMKLISHLQTMAEESSTVGFPLFRYAGDVLLPEAMVRTVSHFEGISEEEAQERL